MNKTNKEILMVAEAVSHEKDVPQSVIFEAIEAALEAATKKKYGHNIEVKVRIDRQTGLYTTHRSWTVVEDDALVQPESERARSACPDHAVGDAIEEPLESVTFTRVAAQMAKQVMMQKVYEADRLKVRQIYSERVGELITGVVKRSHRDCVIVDVGQNVDALYTRDHLLPRDMPRAGDRLRGYLLEVRAEPRGPQLIMSRACPEMIKALFHIEVPEVGEGIIDIKAVARDPGMRAKVAVKTNDGRIDPVGACVGMRGARVQAVSNELGGERIDIILWHDEPVQFMINAMSPVEVSSVVLDEDARVMEVAVKSEALSLAIGRGGQNVRLASELSGWSIKVLSEEEAEAKTQSESDQMLEDFVQYLQVDAELAALLVEEGFSSIEEVAYVPVQELLAIEGLDPDQVDALRERAKDAVLAKAIGHDESQHDAKPADDLLSVPGMSEALAATLAQQGVLTREHLAEQSVEDLASAVPDEAEAAALIMEARRHWFSDTPAEGGASSES